MPHSVTPGSSQGEDVELPDAPATNTAPNQSSDSEEDKKALEEMLDVEDSDEEFSSSAVPQEIMYV